MGTERNARAYLAALYLVCPVNPSGLARPFGVAARPPVLRGAASPGPWPSLESSVAFTPAARGALSHTAQRPPLFSWRTTRDGAALPSLQRGPRRPRSGALPATFWCTSCPREALHPSAPCAPRRRSMRLSLRSQAPSLVAQCADSRSFMRPPWQEEEPLRPDRCACRSFLRRTLWLLDALCRAPRAHPGGPSGPCPSSSGASGGFPLRRSCPHLAPRPPPSGAHTSNTRRMLGAHSASPSPPRGAPPASPCACHAPAMRLPRLPHAPPVSRRAPPSPLPSPFQPNRCAGPPRIVVP